MRKSIPKEDIKWFELFFDIIFVVGIGKVISQLSYNIQNESLVGLVSVFLMFLILFNIWIKVVMLENKIKVIERAIDQDVTGVKYKIPIFIQFVITLYIIHFFNYSTVDNLPYFLFFYLLLTFSNSFLFMFKPIKIASVSILLILSIVTSNDVLVLGLFGIYIIHESIYTYKHLRTISNSLFKKSRFKPSIESEFNLDNNSQILEYSNVRRKLYMPHIIERLGIVMIVFLAEYTIISITALEKVPSGESFVIPSILMFSLVILFYYNYFSSIEHIDKKLVTILDKRKKYIKGKRTIYVVALYFLSISAFAFFVKNFYVSYDIIAYQYLGALGLVLFEVADIILFEMYDDFKKSFEIPYVLIKIALFALTMVLLLVGNPVLVLLVFNFSFIINIYIGKKMTTINYHIL